MLNKILDLMQKSDVTAYEIQKRCNLSNNAFAKWKKGESKPSLDAVKKLADYFNVSIDYLVGREPPAAPQLPPDIAAMWNELDDMQKAEVKGFMRGMIKTDIKKQKENI